MNVSAISVEATPPEVPDGEYSGNWSAYRVKFEAAGKRFQLAVDEGVRSMYGVPVLVRVLNGKIQVHKEPRGT